jgi:hypothetical protein
MPMLVVGDEKNVAQLKSRLFRGRTSRTAVKTAREALAAANPEVDLDRLTPGMVLTVPDIPEIDVDADLSIGTVTTTPLDEVASRVGALLERTGAASAEVVKRSRADRTRTARVLDSAKVKSAVRGDKELGARVKAARDALDAEAEVEKQQSAATKKAIRQWSTDLDALRKLLPE